VELAPEEEQETKKTSRRVRRRMRFIEGIITYLGVGERFGERELCDSGG